MKRALEQRLQDVEGFRDPRVDLEQYPTPAELAAHVVHLAGLHDDLDRTVLDLGTGTGMFALGAALAAAPRVVGLDVDASALAVARENERRLAPATSVDWVRGDATRPPLSASNATVLMNPPFGAQRGNEHADRRFLDAASRLATVSYSVHNAGSRAFVESFAADAGGEVTHAFRAEFELARQFAFHDTDSKTLDAEVYRISWA
ncbi:METTL5 family protein [Salarchaeum sp. JOR-1]|uniref:METTL5 family protein n=1 Tax=Salarchaeum sp. JOR-1 TaxID=2599399 RepID=UPI0011987B7D|nr:METTL5 family protein [Salarchaeum sp. JOR-1]QDX41223.1 methyltransferase [Salarchaeum sp. JOR-1]